MKIQSIDLLNYRAFEKLHITFPETNVAVFVGENGKGKSSVLDAIAVLLSQLVVAFHDSFSIKANSKEIAFINSLGIGRSPTIRYRHTLTSKHNNAKY